MNKKKLGNRFFLNFNTKLKTSFFKTSYNKLGETNFLNEVCGPHFADPCFIACHLDPFENKPIVNCIRYKD